MDIVNCYKFCCINLELSCRDYCSMGVLSSFGFVAYNLQLAKIVVNMNGLRETRADVSIVCTCT